MLAATYRSMGNGALGRLVGSPEAATCSSVAYGVPVPSSCGYALAAGEDSPSPVPPGKLAVQVVEAAVLEVDDDDVVEPLQSPIAVTVGAADFGAE